jgi:hypothetical protein
LTRPGGDDAAGELGGEIDLVEAAEHGAAFYEVELLVDHRDAGLDGAEVLATHHQAIDGDLPWVGEAIPLSVWRSVDLPAPEGRRITQNWP